MPIYCVFFMRIILFHSHQSFIQAHYHSFHCSSESITLLGFQCLLGPFIITISQTLIDYHPYQLFINFCIFFSHHSLVIQYMCVNALSVGWSTSVLLCLYCTYILLTRPVGLWLFAVIFLTTSTSQSLPSNCCVLGNCLRILDGAHCYSPDSNTASVLLNCIAILLQCLVSSVTSHNSA